MRHPPVFYTTQVVYKSIGYKRHLNRDDRYTQCRMPLDGNWVYNDPDPPSNPYHWCRKCFPDNFVLIPGRAYNIGSDL